jgi:hypothetical protein
MNENIRGSSPKGEPPWKPDSLNVRYEGPLEPCPFCLSKDVRPFGHSYAHLFAFACAACGGHGPRRMSPTDAAAAWNNRGDAGASIISGSP